MELDATEASFVALCDGAHTCGEIHAIMKKSYGWNVEESRERLKRIFGKLYGAFAIGFIDEKKVVHPALKLQKFPPKSPKLSAPKMITWEVTYRCDMKCPHCFTAAGKPLANELDTKQAMELIDRLAAMHVFTILLSGGEPLLRPDIMGLLRRIASKYMRIDMGTNGVNIPDESLVQLSSVPVSHVHVSIDGIGVHHDRFRGHKGAFREACNTIHRLREANIPMSISMAVTRQNLNEVEDVIDLAHELRCKGFKAIPFYPVGRGALNQGEMILDTYGHYHLYRTLAEKKKELKGMLAIWTETCFPFLLDGTPGLCVEDGPMGCSAGYDTLCIGADGTVYPCPYLRDFPLGNARHGIKRLWKSAPLLQEVRGLSKGTMHEPCKSCGYAPIPCSGGCRAAAFLVHGNLKAVDPGCFRALVGDHNNE